MTYETGTIIEKRNIVFKNTHEKDIRGSHPMLILGMSRDNAYVYTLLLTSQVNKYYNDPFKRKRGYFLKKDSNPDLKKTSIVKIDDIYKIPANEERRVGYVDSSEFRKIMSAFNRYQGSCPDEYYAEFAKETDLT